ncbi:hypothetical protein M8J76_014868 [Diaphorina citri]|nr:hypothetical protein M8J76_014868 [Diaphorina citri]
MLRFAPLIAETHVMRQYLTVDSARPNVDIHSTMSDINVNFYFSLLCVLELKRVPTWRIWDILISNISKSPLHVNRCSEIGTYGSCKDTTLYIAHLSRLTTSKS